VFRKDGRKHACNNTTKSKVATMILVPSSSSFFPMVGEFHGTPVDNVTIFSFPEYSLEHSGGTEQAISAPLPKMGLDVVKADGIFRA
jgi:hypothetical protein